jgi:hypothetical protein
MARIAKIGGFRTGLMARGIAASGGEIKGARLSSLKIGSYEIPNPAVGVTQLDKRITDDGKYAGLLGIEYLSKNSAIFDFNDGTLYLRKTATSNIFDPDY